MPDLPRNFLVRFLLGAASDSVDRGGAHNSTRDVEEPAEEEDTRGAHRCRRFP